MGFQKQSQPEIPKVKEEIKEQVKKPALSEEQNLAMILHNRMVAEYNKNVVSCFNRVIDRISQSKVTLKDLNADLACMDDI
jgi:hypothetical protein